MDTNWTLKRKMYQLPVRSYYGLDTQNTKTFNSIKWLHWSQKKIRSHVIVQRRIKKTETDEMTEKEHTPTQRHKKNLNSCVRFSSASAFRRFKYFNIIFFFLFPSLFRVENTGIIFRSNKYLVNFSLFFHFHPLYFSTRCQVMISIAERYRPIYRLLFLYFIFLLFFFNSPNFFVRFTSVHPAFVIAISYLSAKGSFKS